MSTLTHPVPKPPLFAGRPGSWPVSPILFVAALAAQFAMNRHLGSFHRRAQATVPERALRWDPELFKTVAFGQLPAAIDWMWIEVLLDPEISHVPKGTHPAVYYRLELIADLDPAFYEVYHSGANLLTVIRDDAEGARDLLLKGDAFRREKLPGLPPEFREGIWTRSWELPMLLGYVYLFELGDMPRAAVEFREAARLPYAPSYLGRLARRLERPGGEYEVGLRLLNFMISGGRDERTRAELTRKRDSLFVGSYLADLNRSFDDYLKAQPRYRSSGVIAPAEMERFWRGFLRSTGAPARDPWGGRLSVNAQGRVVSTTPHDKVFSLD